MNIATAGADVRRRGSAIARRQLAIATLSRELDPDATTSAAYAFDQMIRAGDQRHVITSADIDGLVSAAMLAQVSDWRTAVLVVRSERVLVHPDFAEGLDLSKCFGVDVFSSQFPNVSNHVVLWGRRKPGYSRDAGAMAAAYDEAVRTRAATTLLLNASLWAGVEATTTNDRLATASQFRYPLGTAQLLLALLEVIGRSPRFFDRDFLPWLVANCDAGLETIRTAAYNVRIWWPTLAAVVGPGSLSEQLYQMASNQRANEFADVVHRLRSEGAGQRESVADHLKDNWNLAGAPSRETIREVVRWLSAISGWPDPLRGGAGGLHTWLEVALADRGNLRTTGLPPGATVTDQLIEFKRHLRSALEAFHVGFSFWREGARLDWEKPWAGATIPAPPPLPAALLP